MNTEEAKAEAVILGFEQEQRLSLSPVRKAVCASSRDRRTYMAPAGHSPVFQVSLYSVPGLPSLEHDSAASGHAWRRFRPSRCCQNSTCSLPSLLSVHFFLLQTAVAVLCAPCFRWGRGWLGRRGGSRAIQGFIDTHAPPRQINSTLSCSRWILVEQINHFTVDSNLPRWETASI